VRNLKKAAVAVMTEWGGKLPSEAKDLRSLPGIGEYTAGAISSIAFGKPEPAVDGNVLRVVTRYLGDFSDIMLPAVRKTLSQKLKKVYPLGADAADLTEGIMEIGERVCIPNGVPLCSVCPLRGECVARKENLWEKIPVKTPKAERKKVPMTVFVLRCGDRFALRKRGEKGLLSGMWEFYHTEGHLSEKAALDHLSKEGFAVTEMKKIGSAKHIFTHLEWEMKGFSALLSEEKEGFLWANAEEIAIDDNVTD
jgi:A/G-specific adenine glycosylase